MLAEVPPLTRAQRNDTEILSYTHPMSRTAEAYRSLRSSIVFLRQTAQAVTESQPGADGESHMSQVILVTSAGPSEGKTTTVANLAAVFAEAEYSVLVINCDFRRPRLHRYLGGSDEPRKVVQSDVPGVRMVNNVLSSTHPNPAEVTAAQRRVIEAARGIFDIILLDTAPLLSTNDASELIRVADLVVLVARAGTHHAAQRPARHRGAAPSRGHRGRRGPARRPLRARARSTTTTPPRRVATPADAEAESHPLDLLVRADDLSQARDRAAPRRREPRPPVTPRASRSSSRVRAARAARRRPNPRTNDPAGETPQDPGRLPRAAGPATGAAHDGQAEDHAVGLAGVSACSRCWRRC